MNKYQRFVLDHYEHGEFSWIEDDAQTECCGDTLLTFLFRDQEDTENWTEAIDRMSRAADQVRELWLKASSDH